MKRVLVVLTLVALPVFADDIYLRGGGQITGEIVKRTDDTVTVDIGGGYAEVRTSSVVRIEEGMSPLQDYRARAAEVPAGDAEGWRELARWAKGQALSSQAWDAYSHVVEILPNDQEANRALGRVQLNGKWVTEEESYRAQGYIEFEGEWMTPGERQAILANRRAQEEADRRANEAAIQAIEAEQQADKDREAAEREEAERRNNPVYWGWGAGPGYWPDPSKPWPRNPAG